jgi:acetylornithine deacetylase
MVDFLLKILAIDSTSGREEHIADYIAKNFKPEHAVMEIQQIANGKKNIFFKWGNPKIIFCTHLDTVPPYIPPRREGNTIFGRGACDAKGQIAVMYETCLKLHLLGEKNFGLLLVAGEELGSYGAKTANNMIDGCKYVIIGEPSENKLIKAAKGNLLVEVDIQGKAAHSGYPENGDDAIERMRLFLNKLAGLEFPDDEILGQTTYNIGNLTTLNAYNIVADKVSLQIFFRTTFSTDNIIQAKLANIADDKTQFKFMWHNPPMKFYTVAGFTTAVVAYGSDAPELSNLGKCLLYGAGSILAMHSKNEYVKISALNQAVEDLLKLYYKLL